MTDILTAPHEVLPDCDCRACASHDRSRLKKEIIKAEADIEELRNTLEDLFRHIFD